MLFYRAWHLLATVVVVLPVWLVAARVARRLYARDAWPVRAMAGIVAAFALVAAVVGGLGAAGYLQFTYLAAALWAIALASWRIGKSETAEETTRVPWPVGAAGVAVGVVLAGWVAARLAQPVVEFDALTYHLHFPAQWLATGRIFLIETPFGDAAPGYAPANGELWFAWLMAPWVGALPDPLAFKLAGVDALAKVGQLPFAALLAVSLLALGRRLAGEAPAAAVPAIAALALPWTVLQATAPGVDLMMGALLVAALAFAVEYDAGGRRLNAAATGVALGLAAGVKFVALTYAPLVAAPLLWYVARRRDGRALAVWAGAGFATGAAWYLRNWIVAGNPVFPLDVRLLGRELFSGAYDRAAMLASPFHAPDAAAAMAVAGQAIGFWLVPLAVVATVYGVILAWREPRWRAVFWIAPVAFAWHFVVVPYSTQDRFLIWAAALLFLPLAAWPRGKAAGVGLGLAATASLGLTWFGAGVEFHLEMLRVARFGLVYLAGAWVLMVAGVAATVAYLALEKRSVVGARRALAVFAAALVAATIPARANQDIYAHAGLATLREMPLAGYETLWRARPGVVAYAGRNTPYYLAGREGRTRVRYVNVDGSDRHLHDYVREMRETGTLDRGREKAAWRRAHPDYEAWRAALIRERVDVLFLETIRESERAYLVANQRGFTLESDWATGHPESFTLKEQGPNFAVYLVHSEM